MSNGEVMHIVGAAVTFGTREAYRRVVEMVDIVL